MRLNPVRFKNKPKAKKFRIKNGVKYQVMNIGGTEMEIRVAGQKEIDEARADFARFKKSPMAYMKALGEAE
jgi:hypothetical protein